MSIPDPETFKIEPNKLIAPDNTFVPNEEINDPGPPKKKYKIKCRNCTCQDCPIEREKKTKQKYIGCKCFSCNCKLCMPGVCDVKPKLIPDIELPELDLAPPGVTDKIPKSFSAISPDSIVKPPSRVTISPDVILVPPTSPVEIPPDVIPSDSTNVPPSTPRVSIIKADMQPTGMFTTPADSLFVPPSFPTLFQDPNFIPPSSTITPDVKPDITTGSTNEVLPPTSAEKIIDIKTTPTNISVTIPEMKTTILENPEISLAVTEIYIIPPGMTPTEVGVNVADPNVNVASPYWSLAVSDADNEGSAGQKSESKPPEKSDGQAYSDPNQGLSGGVLPSIGGGLSTGGEGGGTPPSGCKCIPRCNCAKCTSQGIGGPSSGETAGCKCTPKCSCSKCRYFPEISQTISQAFQDVAGKMPDGTIDISKTIENLIAQLTSDPSADRCNCPSPCECHKCSSVRFGVKTLQILDEICRRSAAQIDQLQRATTDLTQTATTDQPQRATTDQPQRATTDQPQRATTDQTQRGTNDQPQRSTIDDSVTTLNLKCKCRDTCVCPDCTFDKSKSNTQLEPRNVSIPDMPLKQDTITQSPNQNVTTPFQPIIPPYQNAVSTNQNVYPPYQSTMPSQNVAPTYQNVAPTYQNVAPTYQNVTPPVQNVPPPTYQNVAPTYQNVTPLYQNVPPPVQNVAPTYQNVQPPYQNVQPPYQNVTSPYQNVMPPSYQNVPPSYEQNPTPFNQNITQMAGIPNDGFANAVKRGFEICLCQPFCKCEVCNPDLLVAERNVFNVWDGPFKQCVCDPICKCVSCSTRDNPVAGQQEETKDNDED